MERVLIVSKTHMKNGVCVSGLTRNASRSIRLIPPLRFNQPDNTEFDVGQVWDIEFEEGVDINPPHVEDVIVTKQQYITQISNIRETLEKRIHIWHGEPNSLFSGSLVFDRTSAYISRSREVPKQSTGYWLSTNDLTLTFSIRGKPYYNIHYRGDGLSGRELSVPYVGFPEPIPIIAKGTLLRVSLARWWKPDGANEERCYLQLSGWYL